MTESSPNVIEIKLDRVINDMRLLRSQMIACNRHLRGIEASIKPSEPSEQQLESKSRPWFAAAASATVRTVLISFAVGAATGAALLYLGALPHNGTGLCALMSTRPKPPINHRPNSLGPYSFPSQILGSHFLKFGSHFTGIAL